jgi:hypothetical protein
MHNIKNPEEWIRVNHVLKTYYEAYKSNGWKILRLRSKPTSAKVAGSRRPVNEHCFIRFGNQLESGYDIVLHVRNRLDGVHHNNLYSIPNWNKLINRLRDAGYTKLVAIGTKRQALPLDGVDDLRDAPLQHVMDVIRSARMAIGPSSGPLHLASLCGTPHIVWGEPPKDRFETIWNPFKTPVTVLVTGAKPCTQEIFEAIVAMDKRMQLK